MGSQNLEISDGTDCLPSNGWRNVGHSTSQSDRKVVRRTRQVYWTTVVQPETQHIEEAAITSDSPTKVDSSAKLANEEPLKGSEIPWKLLDKLQIQELRITNPLRRRVDPEQQKWLFQTENENPNYSNLSMSRYTVNGDTSELKSAQLSGDDKLPSAAPRNYSHHGNLSINSGSKSLGKADYIVGLRGESPPPSRPKRAQKRDDSSTADFEPIEDDFSSAPDKSGVKPEVKSEWYKQMFKSMNPDSMRGGTSDKDFRNTEDNLYPLKERSFRTTNSSGELPRSKSTTYENNSYNSMPMNANAGSTNSKPKADYFREFLDFEDSPQIQTDSRDRREPKNLIDTDFNDGEMMNGFEEGERKPNQSNPRAAYIQLPNDNLPRGGNHRSRTSLDQKTLLKLAASVNELKESDEKEKSSNNASSNNRARRERPKRIDEFHQIKQYFDTLSKNADESNLQRNSRRTQSLDRAKVSNRSQALGNRNFEKIQKRFNSPGNISERKNKDQTDGKRFSKWKLSTVDENYLNQRQYRYTIREPKAVRPPRPELPPSYAIDTDFITRNRSPDRSNEDLNDYVRFANPCDVIGNGLKGTNRRRDNTSFDQTEQAKSAYALSLHPQPEQQFGGNPEMKNALNNKSYLEKTENVDDAADSDSDTASLPSQVENYRQNVVRDPAVRANLEDKIQKCKGKINGNHDIYGSRNSLKHQTELTDQIDIGWNQLFAKMPSNMNAVSRIPSGRKPLVKSGIDIWQNRIEAVATAKNPNSSDQELLQDPVAQQSSPGDSEHLGNNELRGIFGDLNADSKDVFVVTPTDSNKSSFKESEAENDYNFYVSNKSFLNSIPQPYNKMKVGAPYEPSATFRRRHNDLHDKRNSPKVTTFGADPETDNLNEVMKDVERMLDAPTKINDEFSEQGEKTIQREQVEQLVYFPKSKEFFTVENDRDRQQLRLKNDPHFFITVTRKQTEEVVTKIDAGWDDNCPKIPINEDVRSFAREISNRKSGCAERSPTSNLDNFDPLIGSFNIDQYADPGSSRTNLTSQGELKETVLNSPTKKIDYSGSNIFRPGPIAESYISNSNMGAPDPRDSLLSPVNGNEFVPHPHSSANRSDTEPRDGRFQTSSRDLSRTDSSNRYRKNNNNVSYARVALSSRGTNSNRSASVDALNVVSFDGQDTNSLSDFKISPESGPRMPLSQHQSQNRSSYSSYINGENTDEIVPINQGDNMQPNDYRGQQKVFKDDSTEDYGMNSRRQPVTNNANLSMSASALNEFSSKEADSGVELDYNSGPNSDELRLFQSESNLYDNDTTQLLSTSETHQQLSPNAGDGNNGMQKNDNAPVKEPSSRPIKKKIFKKKPKNREDANGGSSSNAQSGAEDGALSPSEPPASSSATATPVTSSDVPTTAAKTNKPTATVLYNFRPEFHGEIAVQKGDVVSVIRNVDKNWAEIEAKNGIGIIPIDYMRYNKNSGEASKSSANPKEKQQDQKGSSNFSKKQPQKEKESHKSSEKSKLPGHSSSEKQPDLQKNSDRRGSVRSLNGPSLKPLTIEVNNYTNDKPNQWNREATTGLDRGQKSSRTSNPQEATRVIVKHNFRPENDSELALRVNDVVNVTKRVDENWYEGTIGMRKGIFPVNCVEVIETHENLEPSPEEYSPQGGVETSFESATLNKSAPPTSHQSDKIPQWQSSNSLNSLSRMKADQGSLHDLPPGEPFKVIFRYQHQKPDELDLEEGDILYAIEKCDDGWFIGTSKRTGAYGTFPGNYVTKINVS